MRKIFFILFLLNFFFTEKILAKISPRIIGGNEVAEKKYPWIGQIMNKNIRNNYCGCSLISNEWALTAAHCVDENLIDNNILINNYKIFFNILNLNGDPEEIAVGIEKIIIHENYDYDLNDNQSVPKNDIALLKLKFLENDPNKEKIKNLEKPKLIYGNQIGELDQVEKNVTVAGWGLTKSPGNKDDLSENLLEANLQITETSNYGDKVTDENMIMATGLNENNEIMDACTGDSGGPLFAKNGNEEILVGIVSWGSGYDANDLCANDGFPGVYTRISHFLNWIENQTGTETHIFEPGWHLFSLPGIFFE